MAKPSLPQGTRDFPPDVVRKRQYIFQTIRETFERYGFQPLETPAMENLDTLMGKYGEEGNKLIFKILNNGLDHAQKKELARSEFEKILEGKNTSGITERALKYDLTIPFARFVAMNHGQLSFPFKRYQIQPVWRADRPARGRYREFYQCDADVVGSRSLMNEAELSLIYHEVLTRLGMKDYELRINSRKVLTALAELCGGASQMLSITIAIDKLDKIGIDKVKEELAERGLNADQIEIISRYLSISGTNEEKLKSADELLSSTSSGKEGLAELRWLLDWTRVEPTINIQIDFTLARGLDYYTGVIFEAKAPPSVKIGSIGGGGRYDDLTGLFGLPGVPGVGISFGVDRIYDVLEELRLFPQEVARGTQVLFFNLGENESREAFSLLQQVRARGIAAEIYHESAKFDKQFKYAEKKNIRTIVIIGSEEINSKKARVKNLETGEQNDVGFENLGDFLFI